MSTQDKFPVAPQPLMLKLRSAGHALADAFTVTQEGGKVRIWGEKSEQLMLSCCSCGMYSKPG